MWYPNSVAQFFASAVGLARSARQISPKPNDLNVYIQTLILGLHGCQIDGVSHYSRVDT